MTARDAAAEDGATPGQADAPADVLASLPRQWDAEADSTAHWGDVSAPERAAYANALHDCASELRKALAAQQPQPAPAVTVDALEAALTDREILVTRVHGQPSEIVFRATPLRPHALAVQLLSAVDMRLTDDPPQPAPELASLAIATTALAEIKNTYPPGHTGHDTAHAALDRIAGLPS